MMIQTDFEARCPDCLSPQYTVGIWQLGRTRPFIGRRQVRYMRPIQHDRICVDCETAHHAVTVRQRTPLTGVVREHIVHKMRWLRSTGYRYDWEK